MPFTVGEEAENCCILEGNEKSSCLQLQVCRIVSVFETPPQMTTEVKGIIIYMVASDFMHIVFPSLIIKGQCQHSLTFTAMSFQLDNLLAEACKAHDPSLAQVKQKCCKAANRHSRCLTKMLIRSFTKANRVNEKCPLTL